MHTYRTTLSYGPHMTLDCISKVTSLSPLYNRDLSYCVCVEAVLCTLCDLKFPSIL